MVSFIDNIYRFILFFGKELVSYLSLITLNTVLTISSYLFIDYFINSPYQDIALTFLATFWGFLLSQEGTLIYEKQTRKNELALMLASARTEVDMCKGTISWIARLKSNNTKQIEIGSLGFSGVDSIIYRSIENIVQSPLSYEFLSKEFISKDLLVIYQTMTVIEREVPTDNVGNDEFCVYKHLNFSGILYGINTFIEKIDNEGAALIGQKRWNRLK